MSNLEDTIKNLVYLKNESNLAAYSDSGAVWERETKKYENALAEAIEMLNLSKDEIWALMSDHPDSRWAGSRGAITWD